MSRRRSESTASIDFEASSADDMKGPRGIILSRNASIAQQHQTAPTRKLLSEGQDGGNPEGEAKEPLSRFLLWTLCRRIYVARAHKLLSPPRDFPSDSTAHHSDTRGALLLTYCDSFGQSNLLPFAADVSSTIIIDSRYLSCAHLALHRGP
ncbi:hypothetical protein EI94DRAFT_1063159 [Lactarius quietus]|nr:hypothetical protein EI94DRAFT_1063159 [Lactarius quietus]